MGPDSKVWCRFSPFPLHFTSLCLPRARHAATMDAVLSSFEMARAQIDALGAAYLTPTQQGWASAAVAYTAIWVLSTDWSKAARALPLGLPFLFGASFIAGGSIVVGAGAGVDAAYVYGGIGGAAALLTAFVHHPSTALAILGGAVLAALGEAAAWDVHNAAVQSVLFFAGAVFAVGYAVSSPGA
jgi:hypothetical protein